jgi:ABC-type bacteriocin/lantibiotic exporter with double-glycine peptidase domain
MPTLDHILHHAPNDMLTVVAVGIGLAVIAVAVLRLVSTTRGDKT